jgi:hypothetical protein
MISFSLQDLLGVPLEICDLVGDNHRSPEHAVSFQKKFPARRRFVKRSFLLNDSRKRSRRSGMPSGNLDGLENDDGDRNHPRRHERSTHSVERRTAPLRSRSMDDMLIKLEINGNASRKNCTHSPLRIPTIRQASRDCTDKERPDSSFASTMTKTVNQESNSRVKSGCSWDHVDKEGLYNEDSKRRASPAPLSKSVSGASSSNSPLRIPIRQHSQSLIRQENPSSESRRRLECMNQILAEALKDT